MDVQALFRLEVLDEVELVEDWCESSEGREVVLLHE